MITGYGGPTGPGTPPGIPSIDGANSPGSGIEGSSGGDFGPGIGYARGGPVRRKPRPRPRRRRFRMPRRALAQRPGMMRRRRPRPMRPPMRQRRRPTGYAEGGSVNPMLMSVSLDSRSKNPMHYAEDREALSGRPEGAPEAPDAYGYEAGGEVLDDDDWEDDAEVAEEPALPEEQVEAEEAELPEEPDEPEAPDEAVTQARGPAAEEGEELEEDEAGEGGRETSRGAPAEEGDEEGGGGAGDERAQRTGYGQAAEDEDEQQEAPPDDTGFDQQAPRTPSTPLTEVLDYTRKQLGVGQEQQGAPAPAQAAAAPAPARDQLADASMASAQAAPSGVSGTTGGDQTEAVAEPTLPEPPATPEAPAPQVPAPPRQTAASTQPSGTQSGPGNMQAVQDYVSGKGGMPPEQMTELLDRTNQTNPSLGQNGAIHQAFKNLVDKGDIDTASKFVQALRPSYDSVRALMIAATEQGDFAGAMQLAEKLNNLIPNGDETKFTQGPDGRIVATIQPDDKPATQHALTPEQFKRYANSPLSLFDHTAEQGLDTNFTMLTGQPGQPVRQGRTQMASANGPMPSDSGRLTMNDASPVGTGYLNPEGPGTPPPNAPPPDPTIAQRMSGPPGPERTAQAAPLTSGAPSASPTRQASVPGYQQMADPTQVRPEHRAYEDQRARMRTGYHHQQELPPPQTGGAPQTAAPGNGQQPPRVMGVGASEQANRRGITVHPSGYDPSGAPAFSTRRVPGYGPGLREQMGDPAFSDPNYKYPGGQQPVYPSTTPGGRISAEHAVRERQAQPDIGGRANNQYGAGQAAPASPGVLPEVIDSRGRVIHRGGQPASDQQALTNQNLQPAAQDSPEIRAWKLDMHAWKAFPYSNQDKERGKYRQALELQERKAEVTREGNRFKQTPEQREQIERLRQDENTRRNSDRVQAQRDANWLTNVTRMQSAAVQAQARDLASRRRAWSEDLKNSGKPFPMSEEDTIFIERLRTLNAPGGVDYTRPQTPEPGGQRAPAPAAPAPAPQTPGANGATPAAARPQATPAATPQQPPPWPEGTDPKTYRGDTPPGGKQFPPDSPWVWRTKKSTKEWSIQPKQPAPAQ